MNHRVLEAAAFANVDVCGIDQRGLTVGFPRVGTVDNQSAVAVVGQAAQATAGAMLGRYYGSLELLAMGTGGVLTVDAKDLDIQQIMCDGQYYRLT